MSLERPQSAGAARRVLVVGGGSAGHVVPAMPVVEALIARGADVHFVGGRSGLEESLVAPLGVAYHGIRTGKLRRYFSLANFVDAFRIPIGLVEAWRLLGRVRPQVVFSKGGFVSFPVVVAAWLRRIPVVAHESDLTPGLANRLATPFVRSLCVNFDATRIHAGGRRVVATGTPLRPSLRSGSAERGRKALGTRPGRPILLVVGGSLGAARLNEVVREALDDLLETWAVVHVCGAGKIEPALDRKPGYRQLEFVADGWGDVIAAADLVVSRAGANALYEWLALGKPHLLVPLPAAASRGDQVENARHAEQQGWSLVVAEHELDATRLVAEVATLAERAQAIRSRLAAFSARDSLALILAEIDRASAQASPGGGECSGGEPPTDLGAVQ